MSTAPGIEGITVARWVTAQITGDAELQAMCSGVGADLAQRVWEGIAPQDVEPWWITFTIGEARDLKVVGMIQVMSVVPVTVKVTAATDTYGTILPAYQRVHAVLESQANQAIQGGGLVLTSERVSGIQFPERTNGVEYRHLGGLYETHTQ